MTPIEPKQTGEGGLAHDTSPTAQSNQVVTLREYIDNYRSPFAGIVYRVGYFGSSLQIFAMRTGSTGYKNFITTETLYGKPWESFPLHERADIPLVPSYKAKLDEEIADLEKSIRRYLKDALEYYDLAIVNKSVIDEEVTA